jgi:IS605 OrfB family transposase
VTDTSADGVGFVLSDDIMAIQHLTCKFKMHNLSAHKRVVIDHTLEQYTIGYDELLKYAKDNLEHFQENGTYKNKFTSKSVARLLPYPKCAIHSSAKDSLRQAVAANLASYFELVQVDEQTSLPTVPSTVPGADTDALENFVHVGSDLEDYESSRNRYLTNAKKSVMPLFFCRSDGATQINGGRNRSRNFSLLTTSKRDGLLAVLWLLPARHKLCKPINARQGNLVKLDSGEVFRSNSRTAILAPLQLGRNGWQEHKFIDPAFSQASSIKTAHLIRDDRNNEYFLHVAFEFMCPKTYEPQAYLGIDRGVFFSMAYAIVDQNGHIVLMNRNEDGFRDSMIKASKRVQEKQRAGRKVTLKDYRRKEGEAILHRLVNHIMDVAKEHRAMIVTEDLNIQIKGRFYKSAWAKMYKYLEYKCRLAGVPLWKGGIWAAYSSQICIHCGELNGGRKRDGSPFACSDCGAQYHSDAGAGVNIARRAMYRKKDWENKGGYMAFHRSFAKGDSLDTENDLQQVAVSQPEAGG